MKDCSGNCSAPASDAASAPLAPNADGHCNAGPEMLDTSSLRGCKSSSMRGGSTPTASKW
eukprot:3242691-Alexandrium_andersonii.AAC.1